PGEISVRLRKAELRETMHHFRARERFGKKDHIRVFALDSCDRPLPEREGLGVRIVDAKDAYAFVHPVCDDAEELLPQCLPLIALEVERLDVLLRSEELTSELQSHLNLVCRLLL